MHFPSPFVHIPFVLPLALLEGDREDPSGRRGTTVAWAGMGQGRNI